MDFEDKLREMSRKEITEALSQLTERMIDPRRDPRIYWAREVTILSVIITIM